MVEPLLLEIFDVAKPKLCERRMSANEISLRINIVRKFPDVDLQREHGKLATALVGLNIAAPKMKL